jgi:hypothetical protein
MLGGQDDHLETGLAERADPLLRIEVRRVEQGRIFLPVTPFLPGESVHSEMQEGCHLEFLPFQLAFSRDEACRHFHFLFERAAIREYQMLFVILLLR